MISDEELPEQVDIDEPEQRYYKDNSSMLLNYSVSDLGVGIESCWFYILVNSTGATEIATTILPSCANSTFSVADDETFTLYLYTNDTNNNTNYSSVTFATSTTKPQVILNSPTNNQWFNNESNIYFNYTPTDSDGIDTCELYGNWTGIWHNNYTNISVENATQDSIARNLTEGYYKWNVWCNDTIDNGNWNLNNLTFGIDTTFPHVIITNPLNDSTSESLVWTIKYNISDKNIKSCYSTLRNSTGSLHNYGENTSVTCSETGSRTISVLRNGEYTFTLWGEDKAGNLNYSTITFESSGGAESGSASPPFSVVPPEEVSPSCGNGFCEEGESFWTCPIDCGGLNIDDLILSCFSDDPLEKQKCIATQSPVLFYIGIIVIILALLTMIGKTSWGKKYKIFELDKKPRPKSMHSNLNKQRNEIKRWEKR